MSNLWDEYFDRLEQFTNGKTTPKDFNYAVHVSLKYKYIFVETPKVACSTIKMTLQGMELEESNFKREESYALHAREFSPLLALQHIPNFERFFDKKDFFLFCFVRNPYSRLLSCYLDKIEKPKDNFSFKKNILKSMGLDENKIEYQISFEDFVLAVERQDSLEMDYHWRQQTYLTCQDVIKYNYIGRLEMFSDDFFSIGKSLSPAFSNYYKVAIRHKSGANDLMKKYYSDDLYERVYKIYEMDFINFSYSHNYFDNMDCA
jgi:dermatan 4-sulfotransferase 1